MSSIEQTVNNVVVEEVKVKKPKAKSFAQKDKKTMFSIMGFLLNLKEQGILDDEKVMECLEALPLYKTAAEKTAFFQQDMFDTKKVEDELYKPMVVDYKKAKKTKKEKKEKKQVEKPKAKKVAVEGDEPKRGRKPKEQIVELAQEQEQSNHHSTEEESLDVLIQSMNQKEEPITLENIQVEDVDDILNELEAEVIVDIPPPPIVSTPILKEKKEKITENKKEDKEKPVKKTKKNSSSK